MLQRLAAAIGFALASLLPAEAESAELSLALVLAVDASGSVDSREFALQLEGLSAAFRDPQVIAAIGKTGPIAVCLMQWSSPGQQKLAVDWTLIENGSSATDFADSITAAGRLIDGETAIAPALRFAMALLDRGAPQARRRVIDLSGDGASNWGSDPDALRDVAVQAGITINGLAILNEQADLGDYYRRHVIGGAGAFLIEARDYADFTQAMQRKLIREIEGTPVGGTERRGGARRRG